MAHVLQAARVNADSLEHAWDALRADIVRLGTQDNFFTPILSLDPETKQVVVSGEKTPFDEDPKDWRRVEAWVRNCWELAFHEVGVGPLHEPWVQPKKAKQFAAKLQAAATEKLPALFFAEVLKEFRALYRGVTARQTGDLLESQRREYLVSVFERARRSAPEALPFIGGIAPGEWPALDVHALGQKGRRRLFFLLCDLHVRGV